MWETLFQELGINRWNRKERLSCGASLLLISCGVHFFFRLSTVLVGNVVGKEKGPRDTAFVDEDAEQLKSEGGAAMVKVPGQAAPGSRGPTPTLPRLLVTPKPSFPVLHPT